MSEIATYTFLPWLRQGLANQISGSDGNRSTIPVDVNIRGERVDGSDAITSTVRKDIQIYGPGDITGIDKRAIIKVEPRHWITNFEPNYLPYIDFYDEDFPWRYTPEKNPTADHRLKPWLTLIVLKEEEFGDGKNIKDKPLPFIKISPQAKLPDLSQSWAWAHVQVNESLLEGTEAVTVRIEEERDDELDDQPSIIKAIDISDAEKLKFDDDSLINSAISDIINRNPDLAYSRIVCPRKLEDKVAYHAFLVPTFESGRLAGLGLNPSDAGIGDLAWYGKEENKRENRKGREFDLPYYHRWYFRTGTIGDFEYLVRLLDPKPVDSRVGVRDMDVQRPGANLKGLIDADGTAENEKLNGILRLGGVLRIPQSSQKDLAEAQKYEYWAFGNDLEANDIAAIDDPEQNIEQPDTINNFHSLQENIGAFINLSDTYQKEEAGTANSSANIEEAVAGDSDNNEYTINDNPDPLITAPLYGRWHALTQRLIKERDNSALTPNYNWIHELNLDPRFRVSAGFGTKVVQENQEDYMKAAWEQIGDVLEANRRIREAQLAKATSEVWYERHLRPIKERQASAWLTMTSPIHRRVLAEGVTVYHQKKQSKLTTAATSVNMRKVMRPRGKFLKRLPFDNTITPDNLYDRINESEVSAAPPREVPNGIQTPNDVANAIKPDRVPDVLINFLRKFPWLRWVLLAIAVLLILFLIIAKPSTAVVSTISFVVVALVYLFLLLSQWNRQQDAAKAILEENQTPESVDALPNSSDFRISTPEEGFEPQFGGNTDSAEAQRFKTALKEANTILVDSKAAGARIERPKLNIEGVNEATFKQIKPDLTIPRWINAAVQLPYFVIAQMKETFTEAMAYPTFDLPMYKPLADYSAELFLPNINYIDQNSISLLETNQKFIEAYMVGLNHEFARELLWREYPTDQRGSYFRQFWEASGFMDTQAVTKENLLVRYNKVFETKGMYIPELIEYWEQLKDGSIADGDLAKAHQLILKEEHKDIAPIHYWKKGSRLGDHDYRESPGEKEDELVLVIRGELLKKYPTAVIYAHRAVWQDENNEPALDDTRTLDKNKERMLRPIDNNNPSRTVIKSPLYEAKVDPDIYFFGFDLTVEEAQGGDGSNPDDDPGWFFVIKERPGEPRFGLDIGDGGNIEDGKIELWNDLSWGDITPAVPKDGFLQIVASVDENGDPVEDHTPTITAIQDLEAEDSEKIEQQGEDQQIQWSENMSSAELAYILYQVPVLVGVHASEMLPK